MRYEVEKYGDEVQKTTEHIIYFIIIKSAFLLFISIDHCHVYVCSYSMYGILIIIKAIMCLIIIIIIII